jgi:hypothetical protein
MAIGLLIAVLLLRKRLRFRSSHGNFRIGGVLPTEKNFQVASCSNPIVMRVHGRMAGVDGADSSFFDRIDRILQDLKHI